jgi:cytochrome P450
VLQAADLLGSNRPAIPLSLDGPEHTKYRRLLDPVFTARRIAPLADSVRALANELIDRFIDRGEADVYREWCEPLPGTVFIRILGLPLDDLPNFLRFKNMVLGNEFASMPFDVALARRDQAVEWIQQYFNRSLDERMAGDDPGDDLLGWLLTTEVEGQRLTREDILDILGLLMIAGLDTVAASLACMLSYFARHAEQRAQVVADPSLWPSAVEELAVSRP